MTPTRPRADDRAVVTRPAVPAGARQRYESVRRRAESTTSARVARRARELDVTNHALIMASLSLTLLIPALVTVAAVVPLGDDQGLAAGFIRRLGLSGQAADALRSIFPDRTAVSGSTTGLSGVVTILFAVGWPSELQRGYEAVWSLPSRGLRDLWRPLVWLVSFLVVVAGAIGASGIGSVPLRLLLGLLVSLPLLVGWTWWTQHLLLGGRVSWPELLPGALVTSAGLIGFGVAMHLYVPAAIVTNSAKYGPLGVVMVLLSWVMGFSVVMLGGPLVGHAVATAARRPPGDRRRGRRHAA